jgi:mannosyltransferase OCH1-like enzyme
MKLLIILVVVILLICYLVVEYEKSWERYREKRALKRIKPKVKKDPDNYTVEEEDSVPKKIIQTYKDKDSVPSFVFENIREKNKDWDYYFYDDEKIIQFLKEEYPPRVLKKYKSFSRGAHRADLFRLCWLYKNGGVYIDIDTQVLEPLDNIVEGKKFTMPLTIGDGDPRLLNAFIIANKGNPLLMECIEGIMQIEDKDLKGCYCLILRLMQDIMGDRIEYDFREKKDKKEWYIADMNGKKIANSKYEGYDQKRGFS